MGFTSQLIFRGCRAWGLASLTSQRTGALSNFSRLPMASRAGNARATRFLMFLGAILFRAWPPKSRGIGIQTSCIRACLSSVGLFFLGRTVNEFLSLPPLSRSGPRAEIESVDELRA